MKKSRLKTKKLAKKKVQLISTDSDSAKLADKDANVSREELLAKARAEARGRAEETNDGPPSIAVVFLPKPDRTNMLGSSPQSTLFPKPPRRDEADSYRATVGEETFIRDGAESFAEFQQRVADSSPIGSPALTVFWPEDAPTST